MPPQRFKIPAGEINNHADAECVKESTRTQKTTIDNGAANPFGGEMASCIPHGFSVCDNGV